MAGRSRRWMPRALACGTERDLLEGHRDVRDPPGAFEAGHRVIEGHQDEDFEIGPPSRSELDDDVCDLLADRCRRSLISVEPTATRSTRVRRPWISDTVTRAAFCVALVIAGVTGREASSRESRGNVHDPATRPGAKGHMGAFDVGT